ncbi:MAG: lipopolysaccharide assembly protein LapB [Porticoccus sp.]|nr:lipopolysaccharide assembly protein LapB [Porticoccus sp.]
MPEFLYILLVLLLILAWVAGRANGLRQPRKESTGELAKHYFQGVNFLLNEQPDQAIDTFIRSVDVTPHTLETHLALGNLMRQRGEVDRAIRVHQNLLSRSTLNQQQLSQAHLELGRDFLKAGLLDRAERLFLDLVEDASGNFRQESLCHLVQIYRDEQEWRKAIRAAGMMQKTLFGRANNNLNIEQAHFCCELAKQSMDKGDPLDARRHLKAALRFNKNSARANILWGDLEVSALNFQAALKHYRVVPQQQSDCLPEILVRVRGCYDNLNDQGGLLKQLRGWLKDYPGASVLQSLAEVIRKKDGENEAALFLGESLTTTPSIKGLSTLLDIRIRNSQGVVQDNLSLLQNVLEELVRQQPSYRCLQCGFKGAHLHWLCPQCQRWETVKPIRGLAGE